MRHKALFLALLVGSGTAFTGCASAAARSTPPPPVSGARLDAPLSGAPLGAPVTTIIFVRHAEAAGGNPQDPSLSPVGEQRAQALLKAVSTAGIAAIYTSQYQRTQQTGGVVARALGVPLTAVPASSATAVNGAPATHPREADAAALVARILREHTGRTVLVVGHSNTVPVLVKQAARVTVDAIADSEFDRMYIVTIRGGVTNVIQARY